MNENHDPKTGEFTFGPGGGSAGGRGGSAGHHPAKVDAAKHANPITLRHEPPSEIQRRYAKHPIKAPLDFWLGTRMSYPKK